MTEYKAVLKNWHKGTGGGPGLDIYFQSWSADKLNKYDINLSDYDHTVVCDRPAIVFENYICDDSKKPYLTIIHLWDDITHNLLSSKFDPFYVEDGCGEVGITLESSEDKESSPVKEHVTTPTGSAKKKRKYKKNKLPMKDDDEDSCISSAVKGVLNMLDNQKKLLLLYPPVIRNWKIDH